MDMKLELVPVPVADVDRAKAFYTDKVQQRDADPPGPARKNPEIAPRPSRRLSR